MRILKYFIQRRINKAMLAAIHADLKSFDVAATTVKGTEAEINNLTASPVVFGRALPIEEQGRIILLSDELQGEIEYLRAKYTSDGVQESIDEGYARLSVSSTDMMRVAYILECLDQGRAT